jgi:predicted phosphodiesterase
MAPGTREGGKTMKARFLPIVILALALAPSASARNPDGTLGLIQTPNSGVPVITTPGAAFEAELTGKAELSLTGPEGSIQLAVTWTDRPGGQMTAQCTVPAHAPPGAYALEAAGPVRDLSVRSVFIRESLPDSYTVAHITDIHIGADRPNRSSQDTFRNLVNTLNHQDVAFVLVTGDITHDGTAEQHRAFADILDTCVHPTFVCAGNHDRLALNYERTFGPLTYTFRFGPDGYLVFDTKDYLTADELGPQDGQLQRYRRAIKPARWSIGAVHRCQGQIHKDGQRHEPGLGMRSQLTLFIDDPLDIIIAGHWHREGGPGEETVMWDTTPLLATPTALSGAFRLITVDSQGIHPKAVEFAQ